MKSNTIEDLLGGPQVLGHKIRSEMDLYELGKTGIPKKSLLIFSQKTNMTIRTISSTLHTTERTLQRKKELDVLSESLSEHIIQLAAVYSRGNEIFEDIDHFQTWVKTTNKALGNKKPMELLSSRFGAQMVLDELGRIEHGVYS